MFRRIVLLVLAAAVWVTLLPAPLAAQEVTLTPTVVAASEPPTLLVGNDVTSFSIPSPGVFWHTQGFCPPRPPSAAPDDSVADSSAPASPSAGEAATDFTIKRTTVRGDEWRTLTRKVDPTVGEPEWVCNQYAIRSNIVADADNVYWVDSTGLVRLPVTANVGDMQQTVDSSIGGNEPVELVMTPDRVLGVVNYPAGIFQLARSHVYAYNKADGASTYLTTYLSNVGLSSPAWDGDYVYFKLAGSNDLVRLDGAGNRATIANNAGAYFPEGRVLTCLGISCTTTHYVFYAQGNFIRRYNNNSGATDTIQTRAGTPVSLVAAPTGAGGLLGSRGLYWFESVFTPSGGFGGTYTHTLYRAGRGVNSTAEVLYFYNDASITPISPSRLTSNGTWLFWAEGTSVLGQLKRLPNDVDALPKVDMSVTGYEVTQGVQRNDNSVRLVQGRSTFVRVFVQGAGQNVAGATLRLYGSFNGGEFGPLLPLEKTHMTAKAAPDRNTLGDSFLFQLPHGWTLQPQIGLRAVLNPFQVPPEPNYGNNQLAGAVSFSPAFPLDVILYAANYRIQRSPTDFTDYTVADAYASIDWMRRTYPLAEDGLTYRVWTINGGALLGSHVTQAAKVCQDMPAANRSLCAADWVMGKIGAMAANPNFAIPARSYLYGLIVDSDGIGGAFPRGQAGGRIGAGPTATSITTKGYRDYGYYTGHEIGHELGRPHPVPNSDDPATTVDNMNQPIVEGCGHSRDDASYPYALARIGPGNGSVRGFDRSRPSMDGLPDYAVLDDVNSFDMMSYCGNSQLRWPSDYTWELLYQRLQQDAQPSAAALNAPLGGEYLGLYGAVYGDAVVVQNLTRLNGTLTPPPAGPGDYTVRLLDAADGVVAEHAFQPEAGDESRPFGVVVPFAPGTRRVQIVATAGGPPLFDRPISANAPVVTAVTLPGAPDPVDGTVTVAWAASDADGDPLTFDVYYSFDGGGTFQPVALGVSGDGTQVDTSTLGGGTGIVRVVASDGVNEGMGDSAPFAVAVKPPYVQINSPADGATYNWGQLVHLSGDALDTLDGLLPGGSLTWYNQAGWLGTGTVLDVSDLPVGTNVLTLAAQNSAGLSTSAQVTITVGDELALPGPQLEVTPAALGFQFDTGSTAAQARTLLLSNSGGPAAIAWAATSSEPWLTLDVAGGADVPAALQVTAAPQGLAEGLEHAATITITGTPVGGAPQVRIVEVRAAIGNSFANPNGSVPPPAATNSTYLPLIGK